MTLLMEFAKGNILSVEWVEFMFCHLVDLKPSKTVAPMKYTSSIKFIILSVVMVCSYTSQRSIQLG